MSKLRVTATLLLLSATVLSARVADDRRVLARSALGSPSSDLVFNALVAPCRIYDTRATSGVQGAGTGPLPPGVAVALEVADSVVTSCGVPPGQATAAMLNFIAVSPAGPGHLVAWPWDDGPPLPPTASVINYAAVGGLNIANGVVQPFCDSGTGSSCIRDLFLLPGVSATHVVIDVLGWFAPPQAKPLECTTSSTSWAEPSGIGIPFSVEAMCPAGYTRSGGGFQDLFASDVRSSYPDGTAGWRCSGQGTGGSFGTSGNCFIVCCRVPGT